jgi:hypothetical protein
MNRLKETEDRLLLGNLCNHDDSLQRKIVSLIDTFIIKTASCYYKNHSGQCLSKINKISNLEMRKQYNIRQALYQTQYSNLNTSAGMMMNFSKYKADEVIN